MTREEIKDIIREELSRVLEQDALAGGQTAFKGQAQDPLAGQTAFAAKAQGAVQALAGVKKQLAALSAEIDKVLASMK